MFNKNQLKTIFVAVTAIALLLGGVVAAVTLTSPEHVADTPLTPTPSPTPETTPEPTPNSNPTEVHFSSNLTVGHFYIGDTIRKTAQLNKPVAGINITLYNLGNVVITATTDETGKAVFDRTPINPFDYYVTASIP